MGSAVKKLAEFTTAGGATASFTSISQAYGDLVFLGSVKSSRSDRSDYAATWMTVTFNGDTSAVYYYAYNYARDGSQKFEMSASNSTHIRLPGSGASQSSNISFSTFRVTLPGYSDASVHKRMDHETAVLIPGGSNYITTANNGWNDNAAINRVDFALSTGNYVTGSVISLYGIEKS